MSVTLRISLRERASVNSPPRTGPAAVRPLAPVPPVSILSGNERRHTVAPEAPLVSNPDPRRRLPAVGAVCDDPAARPLISRFGRPALAAAVRAVLADARAHLAVDPVALPSIADLLTTAEHRLADRARETLFPVINATGVVIHTNLGRAPLAPEAVAAAQAAAGYGNLELDLETGRRSSRLDHLDALIAVNVKGTLFGCQAAGRHMAANGGGSIINMSSAAMLVPSPRVAAYAMTKGAVVQLTRIMALEVGKLGVRVNAIAPGFVPTKMTSRYYVRPDGTEDEAMKAMVLEPMAKYAPLRRVGEPSDIGYAVLYLASAASSYVTGQVLSPNGGVAMH